MATPTAAAYACLRAFLCRQVKAVALLGALAVRGFHQSEADRCPRPHLAVLVQQLTESTGEITDLAPTTKQTASALKCGPFGCMMCVSHKPV